MRKFASLVMSLAFANATGAQSQTSGADADTEWTPPPTWEWEATLLDFAAGLCIVSVLDRDEYIEEIEDFLTAGWSEQETETGESGETKFVVRDKTDNFGMSIELTDWPIEVAGKFRSECRFQFQTPTPLDEFNAHEFNDFKVNIADLEGDGQVRLVSFEIGDNWSRHVTQAVAPNSRNCQVRSDFLISEGEGKLDFRFEEVADGGACGGPSLIAEILE